MQNVKRYGTRQNRHQWLKYLSATRWLSRDCQSGYRICLASIGQGHVKYQIHVPHQTAYHLMARLTKLCHFKCWPFNFQFLIVSLSLLGNRTNQLSFWSATCTASSQAVVFLVTLARLLFFVFFFSFFFFVRHLPPSDRHSQSTNR